MSALGSAAQTSSGGSSSVHSDDLVAAVGQAVEMLEDDAMAAGHDRSLRDVDDTKSAIVGERPAGVQELRPAGPEDALGAPLAFAELHAACGRLLVVEPRRRDVRHLVTCLPGAQAVIDVLVPHPVLLVEQTDRVEDLAPDVHARRGDRDCRAADVGRSPVSGLAAIAVVEPFRSAGVADRAAVLDPVVGVQQLGTGDPGPPIGADGVL